MERELPKPVMRWVAKEHAGAASAARVSPRGALADLLQLHRSIGNRAVGRLLQAKLAVSHPGDAHEREADRVAEALTSTPAPALPEAAQKTDDGVQPHAETAVSVANTSTGHPLPSPLKQSFEEGLGADLSAVRIHTGPASAKASEAISARAYAIGNDIHFNHREYRPDTADGRHLIAHEVAHTVQQSAPGPLRKQKPQGAEASDPTKRTSSATELDPVTSAEMGSYFRSDFSSVRVHTGAGVDEALSQAGARAMAQGSNLYFRTGEYRPETPRGRELIGHELAHVIQHREGKLSGVASKPQDSPATPPKLEADADHKGAQAAAAPFDWSQVDPAAFEAEIARREKTGEPVPLGRTLAESRSNPLAIEIAGKCLKNAQAIPATSSGPPQHAKDGNVFPLSDSVYNSVEVSGLEGKWFIELAPGKTTHYNLGQHLNAVTHGANSRRDGNFGTELSPQVWNYDSYKNATWDLAMQIKTSGGGPATGPRTLAMHNWAFSNIEASETFEVVNAGTVAPGSFVGNIHALEQKMPIVLSGDHVTQKVSFSQVVKETKGWSVGREVVDSTTLSRAMSVGFSAELKNEAKDEIGSSLGLSSENVNTISSKIATMGGEAKGNARAAEGETVVTGVKGKTIRKYVYPVFAARNYMVTAYPHNASTGEVLDKKPRTFAVTSMALERVETIDADDRGMLDPQNMPSPAKNAEDARLAAEKAGKEVGEAGGVKLKIALERELDAQKDFDNQDFSQAPLTEGEKSRTVKREWTKETVNQFSITNASGQKVSGTDSWSLGAGGKYAGIGANIGYKEVASTTAEFGDQVLNTGTQNKSQTVRVSQEVTGPALGSNKNIQVITMPLFRDRIYNYFAFDSTASHWTSLPIKVSSRYYYPVGSLSTKEIPPQSELKPEGHGKLEDTGTKQAATDAKSLKAKIDAEKDPAKKAELEKQLEERLAKDREALEEVVRHAHPSLEVIDRAKNIYEIDVLVPVSDAEKAAGKDSQTKKKYRSTLEALLDFTAPTPAAHNAADALKTSDTGTVPGVTITSTPGLGGTGAQGGVNPFPGDVDMAESIKIVAPTADAAAQALAAAIQETVRKATAPRTDGKLGYTFHGCMIGVLPPDAKKAGAAVRFTADQTMAGQMSYEKSPKYGGGSGTLTLAQAIAAPAAGRSANTYWRGPIDEEGTYGEITKVLNYDAVKSGPGGGEVLFGTPRVGQSFQEVGFGGEGRHDTERARLLEVLSKDIGKYAAEGNWVKALKRAYTVARMLNDVTALNLFEPLLSSDVSQEKQLIDHIEMFANDVVNPRIDDKLRGGIGTSMDDAQALAEAHMLKARMTGIDGAQDLAPKMQEAIEASGNKMTRNSRAYEIIEKQIVDPLNRRIKGNAAFAKKAESALAASGYLHAR